MSLAMRLFDAEDDIVDEERGRPPALPEISESDFRTPAELARLFAEAGSAASAPVIRALDRAAEAERTRHGYEHQVRAHLLIVIDQLDELFGPDVAPELRTAFARLLTVFAETGQVWLLATLRADLYERFLAEPSLLALKTRGAAYDLSPPGPAELAEIVRKPAQAAELVFETDPGTGERLDEHLLHEADRPDMLPLLQLALNRLFEGRVATPDGATLTFAAYHSLGGLAGIVDREAEQAVTGLEEAEIARLPQLLRRLAAISRHDGTEASERSATLTIRTVPLAEAAPDAPSRRLVAALVEARILLTSGEGAATGIRLAHQRVLTDWTRARELVAASGEFYRIREEVEDQRRKWDSAGRSRDLLIPAGLPLAQAKSIVTRFGEELSPAAREFVAASGRRARMHHRLTAVAAVLFAVLAFGATGASILAWRADQRAEQSLDAAKQAVKVIVVDIAEGLRNVEGVRTATIRTVLEKVQDTVDWLTRFAPDNLKLQHLYLELLDEFATTYQTAGDVGLARKSAVKALAISRALADRDRDDPEWQRDISVTLSKLGSLDLGSGEAAEALKDYQQAVDIARRLVARDPSNRLWQWALADSLNGIGNVKSQMGDARGALVVYGEGLGMMRRLAQADPASLNLQRQLAVQLNQTGDMKRAIGDAAGATADYQAGLGITRALVKRDPGDTQWQRDLFFSLNKIGDVKAQTGDAAAAIDSYGEAVGIVRHLSALDPSNTSLRFDIAQGLCNLGDVELNERDLDARVAIYEEALAIMRGLVERDAGNSGWQWALSVSLNKVGDVKLLKGDAEAALAAYAEGLSIVGHLAETDPENRALVRDVALGLTNVGDVRLRTGDPHGAAANYEQAVANVRRLSEHDPDNTLWQRDMTVTLNKLGNARSQIGDIRAAAASYDESLATARSLAKRDPGNAKWQSDLWVALYRLAEAKLSLGDIGGARDLYAEGALIIRPLAAANPANVQLQTNLVVDLYRLGSLEDGSDRKKALKEALGILDRLEKEKMLTSVQITWPDLIREMLSPSELDPDPVE